MSEEGQVETPPAEDEAAITAEVEAITQSPQEQQADRVKAALIAAKKGEKALAKRLKELEPIAARAQDIDGQLTAAMPLITALNSSPKLRAEALRIMNGSRPSGEHTEQPTEDSEASAHAEDQGWYLADGVTPDVARGRRVLDRFTRLSRGQAEDVVRPLAGVTLSGKAESNIARALAETDDDGTPLATEESIREVAGQLPPQLLADPKVIDLVLNSAIGIDRRKRRTPKAAPEPLYLERAGGRRVAPGISSDEKRALAAVGLSEDDFKKSLSKLEKAGGKAVVLGS